MPLTAIADFAEKAKPIRCLKSWRGWLRKRTVSGMNRPRNICWHNLALILGRPRNDVPGVAIISRYGTGSVGCPPQTGCGDKNKIDSLAVTAMRRALNDVAFRGRVVIGEGNDILFSATGVTGGELVNGIQQTANGVRTQTLLIGGADQTCNIIDSLH